MSIVPFPKTNSVPKSFCPKIKKWSPRNNFLINVHPQLIKQNVAKDQYMLELEKRMKDNDVKRQATYLNVCPISLYFISF